MNNLKKHIYTIILPIIVIAIATGWIVYGLNIPIYTFHSVRQAHTAMVAYSLWKGGFALENVRLFFGGPNGTVILFELPIYDSIVALGYHLFGQHDIIAKGVAVLFSAAACGMFISLGKLLIPKIKSLYWLAAFLLFPIWIYHAQTVQPEAIMMFIAVSMILFTFKTYQSKSYWWPFLLCLFSVIGVCIKANQIFHIFLLPWALLMFGERKPRLLLTTLIQFIISVFVAYIWTRVGVQWPDQTLGGTIWKLYFDFSRLFDFRFIAKAGFTLILLVAPPVVLFLIWKGGRSIKTAKPEWKAVGLCALAYLIAGYPMYSLHTYYLNPLVPFVALFLVKGLMNLIGSGLRQRNLKITLILLGIPSILIWFVGVRLLYSPQTEQIVPAGKLIQKYCSQDKPLVVLDQSARWSRFAAETRVLYSAKRFGWNILSDDVDIVRKKLKEYKALGAEVVVNLNYSPKFEPEIMKLTRTYRPAYKIHDPKELGLVLLEKDEKYLVSIWKIM